MMQPHAAPPISVDNQSNLDRWTVGTLCYTGRGLAILFSWLLWGDFAWNIKERAITPIAQLMLRHYSAPDWLVAMLVGSIPAAIGLVLGPVVSVKSDRYRSPRGRRIPFILVPVPFIVLLMVALAMTPEIGDWVHANLLKTITAGNCRIMVFTVFWSMLEIGTIIVNSLVNALVNDVVPHVVIGRFFALFRIVSLLAGIVFNYSLMGKADTYYRSLLIGISCLYGGGFLLMCLNVKEGQYPPPPPPSDVKHGRLSPVISYLKECFAEPFYLWFFLATLLGTLATNPVNAFSVFHARSVSMSDDTYGKCIALSYCFSMVLSYPLGILADRLHPLRLAILFIGVYALVTGFGFFYAFTASQFFVAFLLHTVISGCFFTGTASISQRLLPQARFAEISSAGGILGAICFMFFPPLLGVFIQNMHHDYRYVFLIASIVSVLSMGSFIVLLRYYHRLGGDQAYQPPEAPVAGIQ